MGKAAPDMYMYLWPLREPACIKNKHTPSHGCTPLYPTPHTQIGQSTKKGGVCMVLYFALLCVLTPSSSFITSSRDSYIEFTSLCGAFCIFHFLLQT